MTQISIGFRVDILYPDEYEDFIAEIYFEDNYICTISQDKGFEDLQMEFFNYPNTKKLSVPLTGFSAAIDYAVIRLRDLQERRSNQEA
jgi:hypothetical protein